MVRPGPSSTPSYPGCVISCHFMSRQDFLCQIERCCRQCHLTTPITFPPEHPVEEVGRLLLCCLLKHEDLGRTLRATAPPHPLPTPHHSGAPRHPLFLHLLRPRGALLSAYGEPGHRTDEAPSTPQVCGGCVQGGLPSQVLAHQGNEGLCVSRSPAGRVDSRGGVAMQVRVWFLAPGSSTVSPCVDTPGTGPLLQGSVRTCHRAPAVPLQ